MGYRSHEFILFVEENDFSISICTRKYDFSTYFGARNYDFSIKLNREVKAKKKEAFLPPPVTE